MLSPELQRQVNQLHLRTRRLVDGPLIGEYLSIFKGRGTEFAEVREYEPGDDVRSIDWKVTARLGVPHVKQYIEERELCVMLLADTSASTLFSSENQSKREIITEICAVLSMNALRHNNKVGLLVFSDRVEGYLPPSKGKHRTHRIIHELLAASPKGIHTDIGFALEAMYRRLSQRTMCFVISDFLSDNYEKPLRLINQRHDLIPVCISDPVDASWPDLGLMHIKDLESGEMLLIDSSNRDFRKLYARRHRSLVAKRREIFRKLSVSTIDVDTAKPFFVPLKRFFNQREQRR